MLWTHDHICSRIKKGTFINHKEFPSVCTFYFIREDSLLKAIFFFYRNEGHISIKPHWSFTVRSTIIYTYHIYKVTTVYIKCSTVHVFYSYRTILPILPLKYLHFFFSSETFSLGGEKKGRRGDWNQMNEALEWRVRQTHISLSL